MALNFNRTAIKEVVLITPKIFGDDRGFFTEVYKYSEFSDFGIKDRFVQINHSRSSKGVLRGLHYQKNPKAHSKLVKCVQGEILDVAVDIRKGSLTYGKWVAEKITEENKKMLYIPEGFAHGFLTLSNTAEVIYQISGEYAPDCDAGIYWNDPEVGVDWGVSNPSLSEKDKIAPMLKDVDNNFIYGGREK
jgi:dTDP-4-dehydrorhamnose 3,5-epimerase